MTKSQVTRRTVLGLMGGTAAAALAGCGIGGGSTGSAGGGTASSAGGAAGIPSPDVSCQVPTQNLDVSKIDTSNPAGTIRFATQGLKTDFGDFFNPLIARFEKAHPGTKIEWEDTPKATDFDSRMVSDARTCVMADVINVPSSAIMALSQANLLLDLDVKAPGSGKPFIPAVWNSLDIGANHHHTAYPWYWGPPIVTYNKNIFSAAGLDPANSPATVDELFADAKQVAQRTQDYGLWGNTQWTFLAQWYGMGVKTMNSDHTKFTFADDLQALKWLTGMADLYQAGAIPQDSVTGKPDPSQTYNEGSLAFGSANASFLRNVKKNAPKLYPDTGVGPTLRDPGQGVLFSGQFVAVSVTTKQAPLALAFAQYVTNAKNQLAWCKDPKVVIFPSTTKSLDDPFFTQHSGNDPFAEARAVAAKSAKGAVADLSQFLITGQIQTTIMQHFQLAITGKEQPKQALTKAQTTANKLLARTSS